MRLVPIRPVLAAAALSMALFGAITLAVFSGGDTPASAVTRWTVEVNEKGFNPRFCNIVRNDEVVFKNAGKVSIRVYKPGFGGLPPEFDETLAPGETSLSPQSFTAGGSYVYFSEFGDSVTIFTPNTGTGTSGCQKEAPTPTPTPTFTATPTATPKPPKPPNCWGIGGCAISISVAADGE
ncbi:MAG: hypothetical protein ABI577_01615 [bacterium]